MTPPNANPVTVAAEAAEASATAQRQARTFLPAFSGRRSRWIALAAIGIAAGLAFNWSWLVAIGMAPLLLTALPCVAMCALGVCVHRAGRRSEGPAAASGERALPRCAGCAEDPGQREPDRKGMRP